MRASRADANPELTGRRSANPGSPVALVDFAVTQITEDQPLARTLPGVLERIVSTLGLRAAIAFRPGASPSPATVLAAHPADAGEPGLLARIGWLPEDPGSIPPAPVQLPVRVGGRACRALVVYAPAAGGLATGGQCLCAVALIGDEASWDDDIQAIAHAVATLAAAQLRDDAQLAETADQEQWLDSLIATAIPGVLITDEQGMVTHVSESFSSMFGVAPPEQLSGTAAVLIIRRIQHVFADPAEFLRRALATLRARQPSSGEQITAADGRTIECDYWPVLVGGRYRGAIWLLWDMSDRAEIEKQHEEQTAQLRELDRARNEFVAMISHELRTPLTSIVSFSELIRGESAGLTPDGLHFLDVVERNADRMLRLIGDLLLLSRLEGGMLPLDLAPVSVPDLVEEAVLANMQTATVQDISLTVTAGQGPAVLGDSRRLHQVLDNLLGNAIKFSHRGGLVRVTASCTGKTWRIEVADEGIGVPRDEAARLFGRFVRASNARIAGLPGTGLGLSIVKTIVEMHGGRVHLDTVLGRGTTFRVSLPVPPGTVSLPVPPGTVAS
jgi:signal transduction histidine kinase